MTKAAAGLDDTIDVARAFDKTNDSFNAKRIIDKQINGTPRNNRAQNKQTDSISKKLKLSPKQQRELHDLIHGENMGYQEIYELAKDWFGK